MLLIKKDIIVCSYQERELRSLNVRRNGCFSSKVVPDDFKSNNFNCLNKRAKILKFTSDKNKEPQIDPFKSFTKNIALLCLNEL